MLLSLFAVGCFDKAERAPHEGIKVAAGSAQYTVVVSRRLNAADQEDKFYLVGQPAATAGQTYLGVFIRIKNTGSSPIKPPHNIKVVDADGHSYLPVNADRSVFALDFNKSIVSGDSTPIPNSPAAGLTHGAMILYRIPDSSINSRPVELHIPAGNGKVARIELDV